MQLGKPRNTETTVDRQRFSPKQKEQQGRYRPVTFSGSDNDLSGSNHFERLWHGENFQPKNSIGQLKNYKYRGLTPAWKAC